MADVQATINTAGGPGVSTGTFTSQPLYGALWGINFNYVGAPATTDVTVSIVFADGSTFVLLTLTNINTDTYKSPRIDECDATGTATGTKAPFLLTGQKVKIDVAQCDVLSPGLIATLNLLD